MQPDMRFAMNVELFAAYVIIPPDLPLHQPLSRFALQRPDIPKLTIYPLAPGKYIIGA